MTPRPGAGRPLARRALLAAGLAGLTGSAVAACTGAKAGPAARPGALAPAVDTSQDVAAVQRARAAATALAAAAVRLAADHEHAGLLGEIAADHRAHLAALASAGGSLPPAAPSAAASAAPSGAAAGELADAVTAEREAARAALDDVQHTSPPVAALLARIAGARAGHADLLAAAAGVRAPGPLASDPARVVQPAGPAGPVPAPGALQLGAGARDALVALTAGEHAAVFAYGLIAARVSQARREQARAAWAWHLARRDLLEERLLTAGVAPPAAAPAYDVGNVVGAPAAARLAATVERRVGALAVRAVAATEGDDRREAADGLVAGARRLVGWTGRPETIPG